MSPAAPRRAALRAVLFAAFAAAAGGACAGTHVVTIERMAFGTMPEGVVAGDAIEWRNADVVPHTATSNGGGFDLVLPPGEAKTIVVERAGRHPVVCTYHPGMTATLVVE